MSGPGNVCAGELAEEWLAGYHNEHTRRAYELDTKKFFDWCEEMALEPLELLRSHGNMYLSHLLEQRQSSRTTHRRLASTRQFYEYLLYEEVIEKNPLRFVKFRFQPGDCETSWLNENEFRALMLAAATQTPTPLRDFVLCGLLGLNALRINEVVTARIEDLSETGGVRTLWVRRKRNKRQRIPLDPRVARVMDKYLAWLGGPSEGPLVVAVHRSGVPKMPLRPIERVAAGKRVKKLAAMARVNPNISPHSLRRSFATLASGKGAPLVHVQAAMGHANSATTMLYNRDAENINLNPTFMVCDVLFGKEPDSAAVATPAVTQPLPPLIPLLAEPVPDRLEEARKFAERQAEQRKEG